MSESGTRSGDENLLHSGVLSADFWYAACHPRIAVARLGPRAHTDREVLRTLKRFGDVEIDLDAGADHSGQDQ
ncbi:MAG: hypothetical protein JOZ49_20775 [Mycolicibacterium sp.]|nr:hypothetical protein [Mycolicibacterium sp.]